MTMMQDIEPVPDAIKRLSDQWRAQRAANPPSLLQQRKDDPVPYRRKRDSGRSLFQTLDLIRYFER